MSLEYIILKCWFLSLIFHRWLTFHVRIYVSSYPSIESSTLYSSTGLWNPPTFLLSAQLCQTERHESLLSTRNILRHSHLFCLVCLQANLSDDIYRPSIHWDLTIKLGLWIFFTVSVCWESKHYLTCESHPILTSI